MTKKKRQSMKTNATLLASQITSKPEVAETLIGPILGAMLMGYYIGLGHGDKTAATKAQKDMEAMTRVIANGLTKGKVDWARIVFSVV